MPTPKILALAGSLRAQSHNKRLLGVAVEGARAAGADVNTIDLRDYPLPILDEDLEARDGLPPNARRLKDLFLASHALLIACPEYNSSITPVLKNVIDWVSRPAKMPDGRPEKPLECYTGKVVALLAASPGALGGIRMLPEVRRILSNINCLVIPEQFALGRVHEAFDAAGNLKDAGAAASVKNVGAALARATARLIA